MARTTRCTNHCRACGSHFHSTEAFDAHRQFEEGSKGDWDHRVCVEPEDVCDTNGSPRLEAKTNRGICDLTGSTYPGVTVWARRLSVEEAQRLEALQRA